MATIKDFIVEYENYQYSKEYYDLIKESNEVALMSQFVENQEFIRATSTSFVEGYLCEAIDEFAIEEINRLIEEKTEGIFATIGTRVKNALKVIKTFFVKILGLQESVMISKERVKRIMETAITPEIANDLSLIFEKYHGMMPRVQITDEVLNAPIYAAEGFEMSDNVKRHVAASFVMIQNTIKAHNNKGQGIAINAEVLIKQLDSMVSILNKGGQVSQQMINDAVTSVNKELDKAKNEGFIIDFEFVDVRSLLNKLESYDISKAQDNYPNLNLVDYNATVGKLMPVISETISVYNSIIRMRLDYKKVYDKYVR